MAVIASLLLISYIFYILKFYRGWKHIEIFNSKPIKKHPHISVIVCFRNEYHMHALIGDLSTQNYPLEHFEVIFVNDHSENSIELKEYSTLITAISNQQLISLSTDKKGKKAALQTGIQHARGELILTTDADCRLTKNWITDYANFYISHNKPKLITGLIQILDSKYWLNTFEQIDFYSLLVTGSGAIEEKSAIYCNGANMAFKKRLFNELSNPMKRELVSGDDTFLLHATKNKYPESIQVLKSKNSLVQTKPTNSLFGFINQRIRWASKSSAYTDINTIFVAFSVYLTNLFLLIALIMGLVSNKILLVYSFFLYLIKFIIDQIIVSSYLTFLQKKKLSYFIILYEWMHSMVVVIVPIIAIFVKPNWKNRI